MSNEINEKNSCTIKEENESFLAGYGDGSSHMEFNPEGHDFFNYRVGYDFGEATGSDDDVWKIM